MKYFLVFTIFLIHSKSIFSQDKVLVAERTFKANQTEDFYYAFSEGDQIVFDFEMIKGKEIKEIEIIEYPSSSKFMDYETKKIKNQVIQVSKTGIYIFRFKEKGLSKKVCKFKIQRIPSDETTKIFNTAVLFETQSKTTYETKRRKVIDKKYYETHSSGGSVTVDAQKLGLTSNINHYQFTIPAGTLYWTYRIGVSQEVTKARQQDAVKFQKATTAFARDNLVTFPKTSLAAYALGYIPRLTVSSVGEDVDYSIVNYDNLRLHKAGQRYNGWVHQKGISVDVQKITNQNGPTSGTYYFALRNDNQIDNIDVEIEIVTVKQVTTYKWETYQVPNTVTWKVPFMADEYYKRQKLTKVYKSLETDMKNGSYNLLLSKIKKMETLGYKDAGVFNDK